MKTLKTKKIFLVVVWNALKNMPPREFASFEEMDKTVEVLDALALPIPELVEVIKEGETINKRVKLNEITKEEGDALKKDWNEKSVQMDLRFKEEDCSVEFENDVWMTFFNQFNKWGKFWFTDLQELVQMRRDINDCNSRPKNLA